MRTEKIFRIIIFAIAIFNVGCSTVIEPIDDIEEKEESKIGQPELEKAKTYFQQRQQILNTENIDTYSPTLSEEPSWLYYSIGKNDSMTAVDVDLTDRICQDYVPADNLEAYMGNGDFKYRRSYTHYVYTLNNNTNEEQGFFMTIIPSAKYVENYADKIFLTTYLFHEKHLDGYVLYHSLAGKFVNGWEYTEGKITGKIKAEQSDNSAAERTLQLANIQASYKMNATDYTVMTYADSCDAEIGGGGGGDVTYYGGQIGEVVVYGYTSNYNNYLNDYYIQQAYNSLLGGYGHCFIEDYSDYDYSYGYGGGYGGGGDDNSKSYSSPSSIYSNSSTLTAHQWEEYEYAYNGMIYECEANQKMIQYLIDKNIKIKFEVNYSFVNKKNPVAPAAYDSVNKRIVFKTTSEIKTDILREEMIHAVQDCLYSRKGITMTDSKVNYEFEAKVAIGLIGVICLGGNQYNIASMNTLIRNIWDNGWQSSYLSQYYRAMQDFLDKNTGEYKGTIDRNISPELLIEFFSQIYNY